MILTPSGIHSVPRRSRRHEQGYAMIALLAAMTISLIFMAAALPSLKQNIQREREEEMFYRGEQIVTAIESFQRDHNNQPPTSLAQLTEYDVLTKKRYLRESALRDPLTLKGEWRLVRFGDPALKEFALAYMKVMKVQDPRQLPPALMQALTAPGGLPLDAGAGDKDAKSDGEPQLGSEAGPILGVASKSKDRIIRNYYGIETYDKGVIVPRVATPNQMIAPGIPLIAGVGPATTTKTPTDPRCPKGGIPFEIEGRTVCTGVLYDGICPPTDPKCRPDKPKP